MALKNVPKRDVEAYGADWIGTLRELFPRGSKVPTMCVWSNGNGDSHRVIVFGSTAQTPVWNVSRMVAGVLGDRWDDTRRAVEFGGAQTSPEAGVVWSLARELYGDGYALETDQV